MFTLIFIQTGRKMQCLVRDKCCGMCAPSDIATVPVIGQMCLQREGRLMTALKWYIYIHVYIFVVSTIIYRCSTNRVFLTLVVSLKAVCYMWRLGSLNPTQVCWSVYGVRLKYIVFLLQSGCANLNQNSGQQVLCLLYKRQTLHSIRTAHIIYSPLQNRD